jgi:hypothetical protein
MRAFAAAAMLGALTVLGCASAFRRTELTLSPEARVGSASGPYLQVREIGVAHEVVPFHFYGYGLSQLAVTADARNGTSAPLTLDVAKATLDVELMCNPTKAHLAAVAAGLGDLPARIDPAGATLAPFTLQPGETRTFWIAFDRVASPQGCARVSLNLPTTNGQPLSVRVVDPSAPAPARARRPGQFGLSFGLGDQYFGEGANLVDWRESLWYARGAIKGGVSLQAGRLFESSTAGIEEATTFGGGLSLSWRPPLVTTGIFGAAHLTYAMFDQPAVLGNRGWTDLSVGFEVPVQPGQIPAAFARLGYSRVLDDRTPHQNAVLLSIDARFGIW